MVAVPATIFNIISLLASFKYKARERDVVLQQNCERTTLREIIMQLVEGVCRGNMSNVYFLWGSTLLLELYENREEQKGFIFVKDMNLRGKWLQILSALMWLSHFDKEWLQ